MDDVMASEEEKEASETQSRKSHSVQGSRFGDPEDNPDEEDEDESDEDDSKCNVIYKQEELIVSATTPVD